MKTRSQIIGHKLPSSVSGMLLALLLAVTPSGSAEVTRTEGGGVGIPLWTNVRTPIPDDDWRHIASRYGLVMTLFSPTAGGKDISAENDRVKWIKSLNPELRMLVYGSTINAANAGLRAWRQPREHHGWFLKNEAGEWVTDWEYAGSLHLDPGNKEWQQFMAKTYEEKIARHGYDGVFVDIVGTTTHYINHKKTSKAVNPKTGKAYTDAEWKQANLELLQTVRGRIGDKLMIINGSIGKNYFQTGYADFLAVADGLCNEGFTGWMQDPMKPGFIPEDEWKADVDALADCARRGKIAIAVANVKKREDDEPAAAYDARYRYIAASFLLGMGERHYLHFYAKVRGQPECYLPGQEVLPAFCNVSLGKPRGDYQQKGAVYLREFERGQALVNPTGREGRVELTGKWKTPEGQPVTSPLALPAHTGVILLRDPSVCPYARTKIIHHKTSLLPHCGHLADFRSLPSAGTGGGFEWGAPGRHRLVLQS